MKIDYQKAHNFIFDETYSIWKSDLEKIFRIGTRGTNGGCNLSSCILVFIGIESFSKFFSSKSNHADAFSEFIDKYYPDLYKGKMKNIYKLLRNGLAHNFYPKSTFGLTNTSNVAFGVDEQNRVVSLSRLRKDLDNCRNKTLKLTPRKGKPYVVVPQVLFLDTVDVMERLKKHIVSDHELQRFVLRGFDKVKRELRHG